MQSTFSFAAKLLSYAVARVIVDCDFCLDPRKTEIFETDAHDRSCRISRKAVTGTTTPDPESQSSTLVLLAQIAETTTT
jgi:hypothetical protein